MKKSILVLAVLNTFSGIASAQSSLITYGSVDVGLVAESGGAAGSVTRLDSGVGAATRIGFRGTEDLGDGLAAIFVLETGILADTGGFDVGGLAFGRQSFLGLKGSFGTVNMGRQYNSYFVTESAVADPFVSGLAGRANNIISPAGARTNNLVKYITPTWSGVSAELSYGFGEVAGNSSGSRQIGGALAFSRGPLNVRLGYNNQNNAAGTGGTRNTMLAANYDFNVAKLYLAYAIGKGPGSNPVTAANPATGANVYGTAAAAASSADAGDVLLGATIPLGAGKVILSCIRKSDKEAADRSATQVAVGYTYALSRRTEIYTAYGRMNNSNGAGYSIGNNQNAGSGDKAFNFGVRNTF